MKREFRKNPGDKDFRGGKPAFFNKHKKRRHGGHGGHGGGPGRHFGLAEKDDAAKTPPLPKDPPPAVFEANVFGTLDKRLQYAIADAGYVTPTPIQEKAIPFLLEGRDLIGCAQTGTGKTAAFMLPILNRLLANAEAGNGGTAGHPRALVLSPTRELAAQTAENVAKFSKYSGLKFAVVFGGVSQFPQVKALQKGADTVIATPGRLMDLMSQGVLFLDKVEMFVLDEADRMLDMGFLPDIQRIISQLPPNRVAEGATANGFNGKLRQWLFFSATLSPEIQRLAGELVYDPVQVTINPEAPTVDKISQKCMLVDKGAKDSLLIHLLKEHEEWFRVIVFARTRHGADRIERKLRQEEISAAAIHSDKTQAQRTRALQSFKAGKTRVLVATDIASRGIDVPDIDLVVNMELPVETESYVHRIGRTARAGESGLAISFVAPEERNLLKAVERFIRKTIELDRDQPYHSEAAEQRLGRQGQGLPQAPWVRGGARNKNGNMRHPGAHFWGKSKGGHGHGGGRPKGGPGKGGPRDGFDGGHRDGFGSGHRDGFGGGKGGHRDEFGGGKKKFVHPANAKKHKRDRASFKGRRQPDFGQN